MTEQKEFDFTVPPKRLARREDPSPSHQAAVEIQAHMSRLHRLAYEAVRDHPGKTAQELADILHLRDPRTLNRRLGEVEERGLIRRGGVRRCSVTGRNAATWWRVYRHEGGRHEDGQ